MPTIKGINTDCVRVGQYFDIYDGRVGVGSSYAIYRDANMKPIYDGHIYTGFEYRGQFIDMRYADPRGLNRDDPNHICFDVLDGTPYSPSAGDTLRWDNSNFPIFDRHNNYIGLAFENLFALGPFDMHWDDWDEEWVLEDKYGDDIIMLNSDGIGGYWI